jgi:hypothetical protein
MIVSDFQSRAAAWVQTCFGSKLASDRRERNHRFLEEALELVQSLKCTREEAHQLVDYVFGKPLGDPHQETGGVMVTLAALSSAADVNMGLAGEDELARINSPEIIERVRRKQAAKPQFSPPPGVDAVFATTFDTEPCDV